MDLRKEMEAAALAVGQMEIARLRKLGALNVPVAEMGYRFHPLGVASVQPLDDGLFCFAEGSRRLIVPVWEDGELIDLLAVSTADPDDWWLRTGLGLSLGLYDGWEPWRWREVVPVHRNPLQWLQAGGDGLCVTNWAAPELYLLNDLAALSVTDATLAAKLREAVTRPVRAVPINIQRADGVREAA